MVDAEESNVSFIQAHTTIFIASKARMIYHNTDKRHKTAMNLRLRR